MKLSNSVAALLTFATAPTRTIAFAGRAAAVAGARTLSQKTCTSSSQLITSFAAGRRLASVPTPLRGPLRMLFGTMDPFRKQGVDYEKLKGSAKEAAAAATDGKVPAKSEAGYDIATFAGGCFWGLELAFQREPGVHGTHVGYTHGDTDTPTYEEVCSGRTGHTEAVQVYYDPKEVSYKRLLELFFGRIDPTQPNGQGNDRGTQYRTGVYTVTPEQEKEAKELFDKLAKEQSRPIATELKPAKVFFPAEAYHQQYLSDGGRFGSQQSAEKGCTDKIRCYG